MRSVKVIFLLLCTVGILWGEPISKAKAVQMAWVKVLENRTRYRVADHIDMAVRNAHWQRANQKLIFADGKIEHGGKQFQTIEYASIIAELRKAANDDVLIAAYQGYVLASTLTLRSGSVAHRDIPLFAAHLMRWDLCEGYTEMATAYAEGWITPGSYDYITALRLLKEGEEACTRSDTLAWQQSNWRARTAKYETLKRYVHAKGKQ